MHDVLSMGLVTSSPLWVGMAALGAAEWLGSECAGRPCLTYKVTMLGLVEEGAGRHVV